MKKIIFLGPAWPYRGGIATIIEMLARVFQGRGAQVDVYTFSVQYPRVLFPGRSQFREGRAPEDLRITRLVNTVNPFNWLRVGLRLRHQAPDFVVLKYWTPFMAPCFGTIARVAKCGQNRRKKQGGSPKFLVQLDNIVPHERRRFDVPFTRWFVRSMDGFIYMSDEVGRELAEFDTRKPRLYSPHPVFDHFGAKLPREEAARRLGLAPECDYVLFFGLVRAYKGLDMLLEAWADLKKFGRNSSGNAPESALENTSDNVFRGAVGSTRENTPPRLRKLIVAGEFYDDIEKYRQQISELGLDDDVIITDRFIGDDEVPSFFSLADLLVLPYRSATQSGVTQIAYHFDVPMVVTNVGGLPEIVPDGVTGYVCEPTSESIAAAIEKFFAADNTAQLRAGFAGQKKRFSWEAAADKIEELYRMTISSR